MNRRTWIRLLGAAVLPLAATHPAYAQTEKKKAQEIRWDGRVRMFKKEESLIILRVDAAERQVIYNSNTRFTVLNKPGSIDDLKEGYRAIVLGTLDAQGRLIASRIDARLN